MEVAKKSAFAALVVTEKTFEDVPDVVVCPFELQHVWRWFLELDETRVQTGFGVSAISHTEITNWANGMGIRVSPFERQALRAIDRAYVAYQNEKLKDKDGKHS